MPVGPVRIVYESMVTDWAQQLSDGGCAAVSVVWSSRLMGCGPAAAAAAAARSSREW